MTPSRVLLMVAATWGLVGSASAPVEADPRLPLPAVWRATAVVAPAAVPSAGGEALLPSCLTVPLNVAIIPDVVRCNEIRLSWTSPFPPPGCSLSEIRIYRNTAFLASLSPGSTTYTDTAILPGLAYDYRVTVVDQAGENSGATATGLYMGKPPTPTKPTVVSRCDSLIVSWTGGGLLASGFRVYRDNVQIGEVGSSTFSFTDAGVSGSHTYQVAALGNALDGPCESTRSLASNTAAPLSRPATVTGVTGVGQCNGILVSWAAAAGATAGYAIFRNGSTFVANVGAGQLSYLDTGDTGTTSYTVRGRNGSCTGPASAPSSGVARLATPAAPNAPTATGGCGKITVAWTPPAGQSVTGYRLYRDGVLIASPTASPFEDAGVAGGGSHTYRVAAVNAGCEGPQSPASNSAANGAPATPGAPVVTPGCTSLAVIWPFVPGGVDSYRLYRNDSSLPVYSGASASYTDTAISPGGSYSYTVSAVVGGCEGAPSNPSATVFVPVSPGVPGVPVATAGCGSVSLTWTASPGGGVDEYRVYRYGSGPPVFVGRPTPVTGLAFTDPAPPAGVAVSYAVSAMGSGCEGTRSNTSNAVTPLALPAAPASVAAQAGCGLVSVSWSGVPAATAYRVFRNGSGTALVEVSGDSLHYDDSTAPANSSYTVRALEGACLGAASPPSNVTSPTTAPGAPGKPTAKTACSFIDLNWPPASPTPDGYEVYRNGGATPLRRVTTNVFRDSTVTPGSIYRVRGYRGSCYGAFSPNSNPVSAEGPAAPGAPVVTAGCGQITLAWNRPVGAVSGYRVYRNLETTPLATRNAPTDTSLLVLAPVVGATYRVAAFNATCEGPKSPPSAPAAALDPAPPASAEARAGCARVVVSWTASPEVVEAYAVFRAGAEIGRVPAGAGFSFEDTPAVGPAAYAVAAVRDGCVGAARAAGSVAPLAPPGVPQNLTASSICDGVRVVWLPPATGTPAGYRVSRNGSVIATLGAGVTQFEDRQPAGVAVYSAVAFVVGGTDTCAGSASVPSEPTGPTVTPAAVARPTVDPGCDAFTVRWPVPAGEITRYDVWRDETLLGEVLPPAHEYVDRAPADGVVYRIVAANGNCPAPASPPSEPVSRLVPPAAPALTATPQCSAVRLAWPAVVGAADYLVLRDDVRLDSLAAGATPFYVDRAPGPLPRRYQVVARNACGAAASEERAVTAPAPPAAPAGLALDASVCGRVRLTWSAVATALRYRILRDGAAYDSTTILSYDDTNPGAQSHAYAVAGVNDCGPGPAGDSRSAAAHQPPAVPARPSLTALCSSIQVNWSAVSGAARYDLRRDGVSLATGLTGTTYLDATAGIAPRCYRVVAVSAEGCASAVSDEACLTLGGCNRTIVLNTPAAADAASGYRLVAFPVSPSDPGIAANLEDDLGAPDAKQWRLGHWSAAKGALGGYLEAGADLETLAPGRGYWLITRDARRVDLTGQPQTAERFEITLDGPAGSWHQVGNPYLARVPLAGLRVRAAGGAEEALAATTLTARSLFGWNAGSSAPVTTALDTLTGYWLQKLTAAPVSLLVPAPATPPIPEGPALRTAEEAPAGSVAGSINWSFRVRAGQETRGRAEVRLGEARAEVGAGWTPASLARPPAPSEDLLAFAAEERGWEERSGFYYSSFRAPGSTAAWTLALDNVAPGRPLALVVDDLVGLPSDRRVSIEAPGVEPMEWPGGGTLVLAPTATSLRLRVEVKSAVAPGPGRPPVGAAPNPFQKTIRLSFTPVVEGRLELIIVDVAGREYLRTALPVTSGQPLAYDWSGADGSGRPAPAGLYFARWLVDGRPAAPPLRLVRVR